MKNLEKLRKEIIGQNWNPPLALQEESAINDSLLDTEEDLKLLGKLLFDIRWVKKLVSEVPDYSPYVTHAKLIQIADFQNGEDEKKIKVVKVLEKNDIFLENEIPQIKEVINKSRQIKEKLLQNLSNLTVDRFGWFVIESKETIGEDWLTNHRKERGKLIIEEKWITKNDHKKIRRAIIDDIKKNPQQWKIEWTRVYDKPVIGNSTKQLVVKHSSGKRQWKNGFANEEWIEIENVVKLHQVGRFKSWLPFRGGYNDSKY
ncbi:hypothetical protein [endosymbiont GvMRE of Glomus versiforme]|uniref:hypothetical protein n=1 Tax=endosymbiont GvMRE of Glomus versiforme TaxID=2039283 RepID=UPI000ED09B8A|nr:hypothetical protein [endosymbiont GvMRE of Glomus versiforme]RHZ36499.1 hypothetical protein GvMRE_I2g478 [endosymbiont GvMRE of Glomus versiforme]